MAAQTVQAFLNELRYDNRDFTKHDYDDTQLVIYLNRVKRVLCHELAKVRSDWVRTTASVTHSDDANSATPPTNYISIRELWYGQNFIYKKPADWIFRQRQLLNSASEGRAYNWAHSGTSIIFDYTADTDYTYTAVYDLEVTDLTINGSMPYNDHFNDYIREALLIFSNKAKKNAIQPTDTAFQELFRAKYQRERVTRNYKQRRYYLDF